jgi:hypothetical protein
MANVATMVVIKFGKGLLHLAAVRQGVAYLMAHEVQRFNDGKYHVTLSPDAFADLINAFSAADAADAGFERIEDSSTPRFFFGGLRWETDPKATELRIFGPKSDPANPHVINLVEE